jgi:hypothetical protein
MAEHRWKPWPESCPECGWELMVWSDDPRENWATDDDPVRCCHCNATGHISCSAEDDCYAVIFEPDDCPVKPPGDSGPSRSGSR